MPMDRAVARRVPPLPALIELGLIGTLVALAALAWAITGQQMSGMDAGPGTDLGGLGFWLTAWVVMMAAMMFPSIAPMVVMYARIEEGKRRKGQPTKVGATAVFVCGYLLTWAAAGLFAYALFEIGKSLDLGFLAWDTGGPYVAGGVILAAAIYQLTPLKDVCLRHCRSPFTFLLMHWRSGRIGALRMGVVHGGWCVGCCWGLMAALFALGVMSIGWMVMIAALIALEKLLPWRVVANLSVATLLVVLGLAVAFVPDGVPGLTLPNSAEAARAMKAMGMEDSMGMEEPSGGSDSMGMHEPSTGTMNDQKPPAQGGSMNDRKMPADGGMNGTENGMPAP
jgi:predicted metal-binding membrane protein